MTYSDVKIVAEYEHACEKNTCYTVRKRCNDAVFISFSAYHHYQPLWRQIVVQSLCESCVTPVLLSISEMVTTIKNRYNHPLTHD